MNQSSQNQNKTCGSCRAWRRPQGSESKGECRRNPPESTGWARTSQDDWCISGWMRDDRTAPAVSGSHVPLNLMAAWTEPTNLEFNFHFVMTYPELACEWLEHVFAHMKDVPEEVRPLLENPESRTAEMTVTRGDEIFQWMHSYQGGCVDEEGPPEIYMVILIYSDMEEDAELSAKAREVIGKEHAFFKAFEAHRSVQPG